MILLMLAAELASIEGVVRFEGSREPVPDIDVSIPKANTKTDASGKYSFRSLGPGRYDIRVAPYGRNTVDRGSRTVTLAPGQAATVDFTLPARGIVSGKVTDEFGEPVIGAEIVLLGQEYGAGALRHFRRHAVRTDDIGEYRMELVRPGMPYFVFAHIAEARKMTAASDAPTEARLRRPAPIPTYFPGSAAREGATPITLRGGEHRENVDIRMLRAPSYCLEANIGRGAQRMFQIHEADLTLGLGPTGGTTGFPRNGEPAPDGAIRVCDLHPAEYRVTSIEGSINEPTALAVAMVTIRDRDARGVTLQPVPKIDVPVEFAWTGPEPAKPPEHTLVLALQSIHRSFGAFFGTSRSRVPAKLSIPGVLMDDYYHRFGGLTGRLYIQEIVYGTESILHAPFTPGKAPAGSAIRVAVGHDGALVRARVTGRDGKPVPDATVAIMPESFASEGEFASALVSGRADQSGEFAATRAIAPGRYRVVAIAEPLCDPVRVADISRLISLRTKAAELTAEPNSDPVLRLETVDP